VENHYTALRVITDSRTNSWLPDDFKIIPVTGYPQRQTSSESVAQVPNGRRFCGLTLKTGKKWLLRMGRIAGIGEAEFAVVVSVMIHGLNP
jgi:hypothetical protein